MIFLLLLWGVLWNRLWWIRSILRSKITNIGIASKGCNFTFSWNLECSWCSLYRLESTWPRVCTSFLFHPSVCHQNLIFFFWVDKLSCWILWTKIEFLRKWWKDHSLHSWWTFWETKVVFPNQREGLWVISHLLQI